MAYADQGMTRSKLVSLIISIALVASVGLGMVVFLTIDAIKEEIERVTTIEIPEEEEPEPEEEPPPPEEQPREVAPPPPVAPPAPINISPPPPIQTQREIPPVTDTVLRLPPVEAPVGNPPPPPPPPPAPDMSAPASPRNQGRWARRIQDQYPSRALREEIEGTVGVSVTITPGGDATGCRVTRSSGSSILDDAACRGIERYGQFNPALDRNGNPTTGSFSTSITYRLN